MTFLFLLHINSRLCQDRLIFQGDISDFSSAELSKIYFSCPSTCVIYLLKTCLRVWGFHAAIWSSCQQQGDTCSCWCIPAASVCRLQLWLTEQRTLMLSGVCAGLPRRFTVTATEGTLCWCTPLQLASLQCLKMSLRIFVRCVLRLLV